jgi:broad specificity phosphatase PhoE
MGARDPRRRLHLVRHGRSLRQPDRPPHSWPLDESGLAEIDELRRSDRLPASAYWFSSPEPKALETARRLTAGRVKVVDELREHERHTATWIEDFPDVVRRAFAVPGEPAWPGWEPLAVTRDRVVPAVRRILADTPGADVVLCGHGTAWTLLVAELTGRAPDLDAWSRLRMPDLWCVDVPTA